MREGARRAEITHLQSPTEEYVADLEPLQLSPVLRTASCKISTGGVSSAVAVDAGEAGERECAFQNEHAHTRSSGKAMGKGSERPSKEGAKAVKGGSEGRRRREIWGDVIEAEGDLGRCKHATHLPDDEHAHDVP